MADPTVTIYEDTVDGTGGTLTGAGWTLTRAFIVSGLPDDDNLKPSRIMDAVYLKDGTTGDTVPKIRDAHPSYVKEGVLAPYVCESLDVQPLGGGQARVIATYVSAGTNLAMVEYHAGVHEVQETKDRSGTQLTVSYDSKTQAVSCGVLRPTLAAVYSRTLSHQWLTDVRSIFHPRASIGLVNQANDPMFEGDADEARWLCADFNALSSDGGKNYECTWTFQRNADLWKGRGIYQDVEKGQPQVGATEVRYNNYYTTKFSLLTLENAPLDHSDNRIERKANPPD